jgi:GTP cyclohydrolase I
MESFEVLMKIKVSDVCEFMDTIAPENSCEDWDNVGLLIGNKDNEISKIMVALDASQDVIDQAVDKKVNMIITHHPLIFKPVKTITSADNVGRKLMRLIKHDICVYSAHTNLDIAKNGVNDELLRVLHLEKTIVIENTFENQILKVGEFENEMDFTKSLEMIKTLLNVDHVRLIGKKDRVKSVGVFCGSFDGNLEAILKSNVDLLITGDVKYHVAKDAVEKGICIIDAGHFNTEIIIVPHIANQLRGKFEQVEIFQALENDAFVVK